MNDFMPKMIETDKKDLCVGINKIKICSKQSSGKLGDCGSGCLLQKCHGKY